MKTRASLHITLVATSHVAAESVRKAQVLIEKERPACVAVELDALRLQHLLKPQQDTRFVLSVDFLLLWLMKKLQQSIGGKLGVLPGAEMLAATEAAQAAHIPVFLIDQDIRRTAQRMQTIGWKEKTKLIVLLLRTGFSLSFLKLHKGKGVDLTKVPADELVAEAITYLKIQFPRLYGVLVGERDRIMAANLLSLGETYPNILAFVGAGHVKGMKKLLAGNARKKE